ncbi:MAG: LysR family transcriptional regulator [Aestuariivirgaceae bacterium]
MKRSSFDFNLLRALEVFAAIVETRNITKAAQMLGITQSAASQHLHSLERAFATTLIDRYARPIELTKAGIVLHGRTGRILSEIEDLRAEMRRVESAPVPLLRVGMLASIATTLMPVVSDLARAQSIPEVACFAGLASEHAELLRNRKADLVVTSDALYETSGLDRFHVLSEAFLLVTPRGFKGPKRDLTKLAQKLPLVRFSANTPVGKRTDQHLRRLRLDLPRVMEADRSSMVTAAVDRGHAFAIMTPTLLLDAVHEGMKLDIDPLPVAGFRREITVVSRSRELIDLPDSLARAMAEQLEKSIAGLGRLCAEAADFSDAGPMDEAGDTP